MYVCILWPWFLSSISNPNLWGIRDRKVRRRRHISRRMSEAKMLFYNFAVHVKEFHNPFPWCHWQQEALCLSWRHGRSQDFFGGNTFSKKFSKNSKYFQKILKNFKKYSKKILKNFKKIFGKFLKIFLKKFAKNEKIF